MLLALLILLYFMTTVSFAFIRKAIGTNSSFNPAYSTPNKIKQKFVPNIAVAKNRFVRNKTIASVI